MDYKQSLLIELLTNAIRGTEPDKSIGRNADWKAILEEAEAHHIESLLYPVLKNLDAMHKIDSGFKSLWKRKAIINGIVQTQHIQQIARVLDAFNQAKIPVIVLKGLVLRELYPHPELRTMTDADVLVNWEDIGRARELLLQIGYIETNATSMHIHFEHKNHLTIELHWKLSNEDYIRDVSCYEDNLWNNSLPVTICGVPSLMLSLEDQAVHLCLHMAFHMLHSGFGLRQLCDLVLLVEEKGNIIDWNLVLKMSRDIGIERFVIIIFMVCKQLFGMQIPNEISTRTFYTGHYINFLVSDIFSGGVYGKRDLTRIYSLDLIQHTDNGKNFAKTNNLKYFLSIIFPSMQDILKRYAYAEKFPILIPAAYIHHLVHGMLNRNFPFLEKVSLFFTSIKASKKRTKLLQWLDLN